jgi:hypothetical protein
LQRDLPRHRPAHSQIAGTAGEFGNLTRPRAGKAPDPKRRLKHQAGKVLPGKHWTTNVGQAAGYPAAFLVVIVYALLWLALSRITFDWNAVATLAIFKQPPKAALNFFANGDHVFLNLGVGPHQNIKD